MTTIGYCSDIHLEFGSLDVELPDADVLLLAGDIYVNDAFNKDDSTQGVIDFFTRASKKYEKIIYVFGNHELYDSSVFTTDCDYFDFLNSLGNVYYSQCDGILINDVLILYATMWTDLNRGNPVVTRACQYVVSDYQKILYSKTYLTPEDTITLHDHHKAFLIDSLHAARKQRLNHGIHNKIVVMSHHAPSLQSTQFKDNLSYVFGCTDLDDLILDSDIQYWIHGHTHKNVDYMIGYTRVLSNQRGYVGHESIANSFEIKTFTI
jgi:predicted phosphodiesterase